MKVSKHYMVNNAIIMSEFWQKEVNLKFTNA